jgi:aspartate aminotransferase
MISNKMKTLVAGSSAIRAMFEEGKRLAEIYGAENVCDFSLGNPNLPPPETVKDAIIEVLNEDEPTLVHGYINNSGYEDVRERIAESLNKRFDTAFNGKNIVMTVGAAGGLNVILKSLINAGDEIITFAPYFGEYRNYAANFDAELLVVPPSPPDFQPNLAEFEKLVTEKTKVVIVNNPNNPTGVVYSESTIRELSEILKRKQTELGTDIYIVSDEPYRELVYGNVKVPFITKYYENTIVGYSFSKSLSLPGERIGYLVIPDQAADMEELLGAVNVATRIMGFVNAPSLIQRAVAKSLNAKVDIDFYDRNRQALYKGLTEAGLECVYPDGAFYLWVKSPMADEMEFVNKAKEHQLLIVPGSAFGCKGYVRLVYCVSPKTIEKAVPKFKQLMKELG